MRNSLIICAGNLNQCAVVERAVAGRSRAQHDLAAAPVKRPVILDRAASGNEQRRAGELYRIGNRDEPALERNISGGELEDRIRRERDATPIERAAATNIERRTRQYGYGARISHAGT